MGPARPHPALSLGLCFHRGMQRRWSIGELLQRNMVFAMSSPGNCPPWCTSKGHHELLELLWGPSGLNLCWSLHPGRTLWSCPSVGTPRCSCLVVSNGICTKTIGSVEKWLQSSSRSTGWDTSSCQSDLGVVDPQNWPEVGLVSHHAKHACCWPTLAPDLPPHWYIFSCRC